MNKFKSAIAFSDRLNMRRHDNVLILPHNTLRIVDAMVQLEIELAKDKNKVHPLEEIVYISIMRKEKDLGKFNHIDSDLVNDIIKYKWAKYYDIAPRSYFYPFLDMITHQKFIDKVYILFDTKNASDSAYENIYYDGSIEELINIINSKNITCLIIDDVDKLYNIMKTNKINFDGKTVLISNLGYNYEYNKEYNKTLLKNYADMKKMYEVDIGCINLVTSFSKFIKDKYSERKDF